ncbi:hypothetical protein JCM3765_007412 [Sporobolomyces pararoseus]
MRSTVAIASLLSLSTFAVAQNYGRFPCTIVNGDGTFSPDQSQCSSDLLVPPGSGAGGTQGDNPTPVDPVCFQNAATGQYYCGTQGAPCSTDSNCDNGLCQNGACTGGPGTPCNGDDNACSGFLYCTSQDFSTTTSDTCGGLGSYCQDPTQVFPGLTDAEVNAISSEFCASGYCNVGTGACDVKATTVGADCSTDPEFFCSQTSTGAPLTCDDTTFQCRLADVPSGRARARRNIKINACAQGHQSCSVEGTSGFECVDTSSSLEQCGGCAGQGGVDCTVIEGVAAVGCEQGRCSIYSCLDGYTWDALTQSCLA